MMDKSLIQLLAEWSEKSEVDQLALLDADRVVKILELVSRSD